MAIAFYPVLDTPERENDIIAYKFHISLNATTWIGRIGMLVVPPWRSSSPTGGPSPCNAATALSPNTASKPASSNACPTVPTSNCTKPLWPGRRPRPPHPPRIPGRTTAQTNEQVSAPAAKPGTGSFLFADPAVETLSRITRLRQRALTRVLPEGAPVRALKGGQDRIHGDGETNGHHRPQSLIEPTRSPQIVGRGL